MNLEIRSAVMDDLDRLMSMEKDCFPPAEAAPREVFAYRLESLSQWCFVALADGDMAALVMCRPTPDDHTSEALYEARDLPTGDCLAVICVETATAFRGQGIAGDLIRHALSKARERGVRVVSLMCKDHLIAFYESFGFQRVGISSSVHGGMVWNEMQQFLQESP